MAQEIPRVCAVAPREDLRAGLLRQKFPARETRFFGMGGMEGREDKRESAGAAGDAVPSGGCGTTGRMQY